MPSQLENALAHFRADLLRSERASASQMVRVYGASWVRLQDVLARAQAAVEAGGTNVARVHYAEQLRAAVEAELRHFTPYAEDSVVATQRMAVDAALRNTGAAIEAAGGPQARLAHLNPRAAEGLVGYASNGSPLRTLFEELAPGVSDSVVDVFAEAVALGQNPRVTARQVRAAYGTGLSRALNIARTETLRAYRTATHENYIANDDVIAEWVWVCACSRRSCASCFAMHGSVHALSEHLDEHPSGRCVAAPRIRNQPNGISMPGSERFAALDASDQLHILGPGRFALYERGAISIAPTGSDSIVGRRSSNAWGSHRYARPLQHFTS